MLSSDFNLSACTIFTASKNGKTLTGNNEDFCSTNAIIRFIPPSQGKYGRVFVGFNGDANYQGGMNEHGLAFDINALPKMFFKGIEGNPWRSGFNFFDLLMVNKDISDILKFYQTYHQPTQQWGAGQIHFADVSGNAMVAGITKEGELGFNFKEDKEYLISTNFSLLNPENRVGYPCERYSTAERMLEQLIKEEKISVEKLANILGAVKLKYGKLGPNIGTVYSNICDLTRKILYLYHLHNFSEVKRFDLKKELKKDYTYSQEYTFADNAERERFIFEKMQVYIIEELFE